MIVTPGKDGNGDDNSKINPDGSVELPDGGDVKYPDAPDGSGETIKVPDGTIIKPDGTVILPDDKDGTITDPDNPGGGRSGGGGGGGGGSSRVAKTYTVTASAAASYGWISGMGDGTFKPNEKIIRAQTATIVNRMLARACDRAFVNGAGVQRFTDVPSTHWAYYQIMEAANSHSHQYDADGYETWTGLNGEDSN